MNKYSLQTLKLGRLFVVFCILFSLFQPIQISKASFAASTNISGIIWENTTWGISGSPYYVTGDVQIPAGVTLSIDPGVQVRFAGQFEILVKGAINASGSSLSPISFATLTTPPATFLRFADSTLGSSTLTSVHFSNSDLAIRISSGSTGTLTLTSPTFASTKILADAGTSSATLLLDHAVLDHTTVQSAYANGGQITFQNSTIQNSTINSDAYSTGISLYNSTVSTTTFLIGCCSARIHIENSHLSLSPFQEGMGQPVTGPLEIVSSELIDSPINLPAAQENEACITAALLPEHPHRCHQI